MLPKTAQMPDYWWKYTDSIQDGQGILSGRTSQMNYTQRL
jgi:hypothetical protein